MIVLDEDRTRPICIRGSVVLCLMMTFAGLLLGACMALPMAQVIGRIGFQAFSERIFALTFQGYLAGLILLALVVMPFAAVVTRYNLWRLAVVGDRLDYRSLFRRRVIPIADIDRIRGARGREVGLTLSLKDGTSLSLKGVASGSMSDLARFEDEVFSRVPQNGMATRLFGKIVRPGYTEYL